MLIGADVGVTTVMELIDELKKRSQAKNIQDPQLKVQSVISEKLVEIYKAGTELRSPN